MTWRVLLVVALLGGTAEANGRFPAGVEVRIHPQDDQQVLLSTTFGLLLSTDGGTVFRWVCEDALGYGGTYDPDYEIGPDGAIYLTSFEGLRITRDRGCAFTTPAALVGLYASDIEIGADGTVWAVTSGDTSNALWRSTDNGASFLEMSLAHAGAWWSSVKVAPSNVQRMYVSGTIVPADPDAGIVEHGVLYRSDSAGDAFEPLPTAALSLTVATPLTVLAIWPTDPDVLFVRVQGGAATGDAIYRSGDGGASFTRVLETQGPLEAFAIRADGSQVIAGMGLNGTRVSTDGGVTFGALAPQPHLSCLAERSDGVLLGCGANWEPDLMALGRSTDAVAWTVTFRFAEIAEPQPCPAGTAQFDVCEDSWFDVICPLGVTAGCPPPPADAGVIDATVSAPDAGTGPPARRGCGGCASGEGSLGAGLALLLCLALGLSRGRWRSGDSICACPRAGRSGGPRSAGRRSRGGAARSRAGGRAR